MLEHEKKIVSWRHYDIAQSIQSDLFFTKASLATTW